MFERTVLTKNGFLTHEYNKLATRKVGPLEILEKINLYVYRLQLSSHIHISDAFNVKHLVPYIGDSSLEDEHVD